jgi:hypothetical protein
MRHLHDSRSTGCALDAQTHERASGAAARHDAHMTYFDPIDAFAL